MSDAPGRDLKFGVDRLVMNGRRVFGWGWVAHPALAVSGITLRVDGDGWQRRMPASCGLVRADVQSAFPHLLYAESSGFSIAGYTPGKSVRKLVLELELDGGGTAEIDVTGSADMQPASRRKLRELAWVAQATWRRLRRGDLRGIVSRARAQSYLAPSLDDEGVAATLRPRVRSVSAMSMVFDHALGGGANQYRHALIDERLAAGSAVLLCTYNLPTLDYRLHWLVPGGEEQTYRLSSFTGIERLLDGAPVSEFFVNGSVSFDEPLLFADWIAMLRHDHRDARLVVAVHDYFAVCPSFVLLDADGHYCGIPDVSVCAQCLKRHKARYVALSPQTEIGPWRALWGRCLQAADELRCFSESSVRLMLRAYPDLRRERIRVVPHRVDYLPPRLPKLDHAAPLVIGIVGHISAQKGALVVKEMCAELDREASAARIVIIGTLDLAVSSKRLTVTGAYRHDKLVELIESNRINVFLFPSICPETFSYVTEELIALAVPVVAFDLGAPGERLRQYDNAKLCAETSARAALETLDAFHVELAEREASQRRMRAERD